MKGISFVVDDTGRKTAVLIDLDEWGEIWADFYDNLVAELRKDEPRIPWEAVEAELGTESRLDE